MNWMILGMLLIVIVPLGVIVTVIPYLTRKTESFGVSIEQKYYHDPELVRMRRSYSVGMAAAVVLSAVMAVIFAANMEEHALEWALPAVTAFILGVQTVLYLYFHFRMKKLKKERGLLSPQVQQVVVDTSFHREKRIYSHFWLIPHLLIAAATAGIVLYFYDSLPEQIVMQYDFQGNPTNIADKSYMAVLTPVFIQLVLILTFWIVNFSISISKQQIDAADPHASLRQNILFRRKWSGFMLLTGFLLVLLIGMIPVQMLVQFDVNVFLTATLVVVAVILFGTIRLSFVTGQGGSRIRVASAGDVTGEVNRDDDKYWKLGQFYFNPNDPALFLEKRFGIGWTINFARPLAWVIFLLPLVLVVVLIAVS